MTITVRFQSHPGELEALLTGPSGGVVQDLQRRGNRVLNLARTLAPVRKGILRGSLTTEPINVGGHPAIRIGTNLDYAIHVHEGTGIYAGHGMITPKRGQFMVWPNDGRGGRYAGGKTKAFVFARQTRGMPGRPFLLKALEAAR